MKILVIRACAIGDFVLNLPALEALQQSEPAARFTLVGYPSTLDIARGFISVSAVHSIDVEPWSRLFHGPLEGLSFDKAIVWMKSPAVGNNLLRSGVGEVVRADPFPESQHAATYLLQTLGLQMPELPDLWRPETTRIVLHPGSGSPRKLWPHFRTLAERVTSAEFLIGPVESAFDTGSHRRWDNLSLREVARLLSSSRAFVGNDSGITHLSAHVGVPTVALFGPTDPAVWGPVGRRVSVIRNAEMREIRVEEVIAWLEGLFESIPQTFSPPDPGGCRE